MANSKDASKRTPSKEEIKEIITEEMKEKEVRHCRVPYENGNWSHDTLGRSKRYFAKYGYGHFFCPNGDKKWSSHRSWCIIDLKMRRIAYRYWQKCKKCGAEAKPKFRESVIRKIAQCAVESYLKRTGIIQIEETIGVVREMVKKGKHDEKNCEKCLISGIPCHLVRTSCDPQPKKNRKKKK